MMIFRLWRLRLSFWWRRPSSAKIPTNKWQRSWGLLRWCRWWRCWWKWCLRKKNLHRVTSGHPPWTSLHWRPHANLSLHWSSSSREHGRPHPRQLHPRPLHPRRDPRACHPPWWWRCCWAPGCPQGEASNDYLGFYWSDIFYIQVEVLGAASVVQVNCKTIHHSMAGDVVMDIGHTWSWLYWCWCWCW